MRFFLLLIIISFAGSGCMKTRNSRELFFEARVNGQLYIPQSCANCITCTLLQDTILIFGGNRNDESLSIGISDANGISPKTYQLTEKARLRGIYKNSTNYNDVFRTDSVNTGGFTVSAIDRTRKIISGNFGFKAYNTYRGSSVEITRGKFRLNYTTY